VSTTLAINHLADIVFATVHQLIASAVHCVQPLPPCTSTVDIISKGQNTILEYFRKNLDKFSKMPTNLLSGSQWK
jgi:hypothetical protein